MTATTFLTGQILRLKGVRYRCKKRYVSVRGLDALAQFFYDKVLPKERRIESLVASFGLPRRVLEDVLAELIRSNHALLDLTAAEIRPLYNNPHERRQHHLGGDFEVWQDDVTGAFLPAARIERFTRRSISHAFLTISSASDHQDFLDAPDARIIQALCAVQPGLMESERAGFILDALPEKERLDVCDLYLQLRETRIGDETVSFVSEPGLPYWLTREWTAALRSGRGESYDEQVFASRVPHLNSRETAPSVLDTCRLDFQVQQWLLSVREVFESKDGIDRIHDHRAMLLNRLRSQDSVRFAPAESETSHLQDLWRRASAYMIVVSESLSPERIAEIVFEAEREPKSTHLILINAGGSGLPRSMYERGVTGFGELLIHDLGRTISPEMCIVDGVHARIGDLDILRGNGPALWIDGASSISPLITTILREMKYQNGGWWLRHQLTFNQTGEIASNVVGEVAAVLDRFEALGDEIDRAVEAERTTKEGIEKGVLDAGPAGQESSTTELTHRAQIFCYEIPALVERIGVLLIPVAAGDQVSVLTEALETAATPGRVKYIELFVRKAPEDLVREALFALFARAIAAGTTIAITLLPASPMAGLSSDSISVLERFRTRIDSHLLTISFSKAEMLPTLIVDKSVVAVGGESWFRSGGSVNCSFVAEAPNLAVELSKAAMAVTIPARAI